MTLSLGHMFPHEADFAKVVAQGSDATGTVTTISTVFNMTINDVHPKRISFEYGVAGQMRYAAMDTLSLDAVADWKPGQTVPVRYLDGDAVIPTLEPVNFPFWLLGLTPFFLFFIFGWPFLLFAAVGAWRRMRILKDGMPRDATLLALTPISSFGSAGFLFKTQFEASYAYVDEQGQSQTSSSRTSDLALLNEKRKGDPIEILIVPGHLKRTQIIDASTRRLIS